MERINKIWNHYLFQECKNQIEIAEKERVYCLHNLEHSLDVARIAYIINLENNYKLERELIYAMALLHDLGRCKEYTTGESHHIASVSIAEKILRECDFGNQEVEMICQAIGAHKNPVHEMENRYVTVLYQADKLSRNCFDCKVRKTCFWNEEMRNHTISY